MGLTLRERERQERIVRLQHLLNRASDETKAVGHRGGEKARTIRDLHIREWSAELKRLAVARVVPVPKQEVEVHKGFNIHFTAEESSE